jgi:hypothetical protein
MTEEKKWFKFFPLQHNKLIEKLFFKLILQHNYIYHAWKNGKHQFIIFSICIFFETLMLTKHGKFYGTKINFTIQLGLSLPEG